MISLATCYELVDVRKYHQWFKPFEIMGVNAIFIYIASIILIKLLIVNEIGKGEQARSICHLLTACLFGWAGILNSGVLFAIATVLLCLGVSYLMYHQG